MRQTYNNLWITSLTPEQKMRTCGYWYTVTNNCTPTTAFKTRASAITWLEALKLNIQEELAEEGIFQTQKVSGEYIDQSLMVSEETWKNQSGIPVIALSNGSYKPAYFSEENGIKVITRCNPNNRWAEELDYRYFDQQKSKGKLIF